MSKKGYILLDRQIQDNALWRDKPFSRGQAWIDLLLMANHSDNTILFDGNTELVKRGGMITSIVKLSVKWGWSCKKVSNFLNMLEKENMLAQKRTSKRTALTIVNYSVYQDMGTGKRTGKEQLKNIRGTAEEQLKNTNNTLNTLNTLEKKEPAPAEKEISQQNRNF